MTDGYTTEREVRNAFSTLINDLDSKILRESKDRLFVISRVEATKHELLNRCFASTLQDKPISPEKARQDAPRSMER